MSETAKIKEIFKSVQGEGPFVGYKQIFIRFCNCNLKCNYCDTPYGTEDSMEFTAKELREYIEKLGLDDIHSISLTGGEPLIWHKFLKEFLPIVPSKIYLETNATMDDAIVEVIDDVNIISADIKLPSSTGIKNSFEKHTKFFNAIKNSKVDCFANRFYDCNSKYAFAKIVFDENITDEEINQCIAIANQFNLELILQPKMNGDVLSINSKTMTDVLDKFTAKYDRVRLIPQTHKFLSIE